MAGVDFNERRSLVVEGDFRWSLQVNPWRIVPAGYVDTKRLR